MVETETATDGDQAQQQGCTATSGLHTKVQCTLEGAGGKNGQVDIYERCVLVQSRRALLVSRMNTTSET